MKVAVGLRRVAAGKRTSGRRAAQIAFSTIMAWQGRIKEASHDLLYR